MATKTKPKKASSPKNTKPSKTAHTMSDFKAELYALLWASAGAVLVVFLYTELTGVIGGAVKNLMLGLLGLPAYLLPFLFVILGINLSLKAGEFKNKNQYIAAFALIVIFSAACHLIFATDSNMLNIKQGYYNGMISQGGGVLGTVLGGVLYTLVGRAAWIVLFSLMILCIMVSTKWSPIKWIIKIVVLSWRKIKNIAKGNPEKKNEFKEGYDLPFEQLNIDDIENKKKKKAGKGFNIFREKDFPEIDKENSEMVKNIKKHMHKDYDETIEPAINIYEAPDVDNNEAEIINDIEDDFDDVIIPAHQPEKEKHDPISESMGIEVELDNDDTSLPEEVRHYEKIKYKFPPLNLLNYIKNTEDAKKSKAELMQTAQKLVETLKSFGVDVTLLEVSKGPTVTRYELAPKTGVKVSKIVSLTDDIALSLAAVGVRIEAPIPGKAAIGIEVPNKTVSSVALREIIDSDEFSDHKSPLAFAIGKDISGGIVIADIAKMPHVLIAGATGSGKSVCINTLISSIIYKSDPNDVKFLMIDPKVVELGIYNGIPHLLIPVVTDPKKAAGALNWAVQEMVMRYKLFADNNERNIDGYNKSMEKKGIDFKLPRIVVIIDELADLMMVSPNEVEDYIMRLAQMARAAGIHLVIATQRPSVDVITGVIKANIPSRISFAVSSQIDSRTILGMAGAEKLLGKGDMLYFPAGYPKPVRLQGSFISDQEVENIVEYVKSHSSTSTANEDILYKIERHEKSDSPSSEKSDDDADELLPQAINLVFEAGQGSASYLQRKLKVGFSRASRMIDQMEERGILGPPDGSKPRALIATRETMHDAENFDEVLSKTDMF